MPSTGNLANSPGLLKSWILEKSLQQQLYKTSIVPYSKDLSLYAQINAVFTPIKGTSLYNR